jgi:hypothetical protein
MKTIPGQAGVKGRNVNQTEDREEEDACRQEITGKIFIQTKINVYEETHRSTTGKRDIMFSFWALSAICNNRS